MKNLISWTMMATVAMSLTACSSQKPAAPATSPNKPAGATGGGAQSGKPSTGSESSSNDAGKGGDITLYALNTSTQSVCFLYVGDENGYSDDLLGENTLPSGEYATVIGIVAGAVEIYAEGCDGGVWYDSGTLEAGNEYYTEFSDDNNLQDAGGSDTGASDTGRR